MNLLSKGRKELFLLLKEENIFSYSVYILKQKEYNGPVVLDIVSMSLIAQLYLLASYHTPFHSPRCHMTSNHYVIITKKIQLSCRPVYSQIVFDFFLLHQSLCIFQVSLMSLYKAPSKLTASVNKRKRWKKRPKPYNAPKPEDLEVVLGKWKVREG